ncbi:putative g3bp-like protein [Quercus suber]|uniref:G3bp-like protein n=1 Tax=Quercus suber TaxID=58331 RepID=A0AAW0LHC9_QUESU
MSSVTTMQGINEKILSLDYKDFKAEIKTADAQKSYKDGVTVLVTGCLTGKDNLRRKFAQSFFLAPQDNGYFVLNDVFRYVEDGEPLDNHAVNGVNDVTTVPIISEREPTHVSDPPATDPETSPVEEDGNVVEKSYDPSEHEIQLAIEKEAVQPPSHSNGDDVSIAVESSSSVQDDTPKQSYASIVRVIKGSPGPSTTNTMKVVPKKSENQSLGSVPPTSIPEASAPSSVGTPESGNTQEDVSCFSLTLRQNLCDFDIYILILTVEGYSIYIRNLPFSMTAEQLEVEFKKFGPIKPGGIQVRNNKQQGYCFGFVEFQSFSSVNRAIEVLSLLYSIFIEIFLLFLEFGCCKPSRCLPSFRSFSFELLIDIVGSSGRGRFSSGRGLYRNDSFKSRGSYGGGRGYGRSDYGNRGDFSGRGSDFSGRGRGPAGRGEGYQQGRGRGGRSSGPKQNVSS